MAKRKMILDKNVDGSNFTQFSGCSIRNNGKEMEFRFPSGDSYIVPIEYFCTWYTDMPHFVKQESKGKSRWVDWDPYKHPFVKVCAKGVRFTGCRRASHRFSVYVYLSNGISFTVPWDTVLMSCEPRYEWFGGWTEESMRTVFEYYGLSEEESEKRKARTLKKLKRAREAQCN